MKVTGELSPEVLEGANYARNLSRELVTFQEEKGAWHGGSG